MFSEGVPWRREARAREDTEWKHTFPSENMPRKEKGGLVLRCNMRVQQNSFCSWTTQKSMNKLKASLDSSPSLQCFCFWVLRRKMGKLQPT